MLACGIHYSEQSTCHASTCHASASDLLDGARRARSVTSFLVRPGTLFNVIEYTAPIELEELCAEVKRFAEGIQLALLHCPCSISMP